MKLDFRWREGRRTRLCGEGCPGRPGRGGLPEGTHGDGCVRGGRDPQASGVSDEESETGSQPSMGNTGKPRNSGKETGLSCTRDMSHVPSEARRSDGSDGRRPDPSRQRGISTN